MFMQFLKKIFGLPVTLYGVWIPDLGWLRNGDRAYADVDRRNAQQVARRFGGRVEIIDEVLQAMQQTLIEREFVK